MEGFCRVERWCGLSSGDRGIKRGMVGEGYIVEGYTKRMKRFVVD